MKRSDKQISRPWWRTLSSAVSAAAVVAVIGFSTMTPALAANWGVGVSFGAPVYGYYPYPYPAYYPTYGYYPSSYYYGGYYPSYYYGGYYPYYYGPSVSFSYSHR